MNNNNTPFVIQFPNFPKSCKNKCVKECSFQNICLI